MTHGLVKLGSMLNSIEQPTSPLYFKNIEGFYYGFQNPSTCFKRFGWQRSDFEFAIKP